MDRRIALVSLSLLLVLVGVWISLPHEKFSGKSSPTDIPSEKQPEGKPAEQQPAATTALPVSGTGEAGDRTIAGRASDIPPPEAGEGPIQQQLFHRARTVQERSTPPDKRGHFTKQRVVEAADSKYPFLRIEEDWVRDPLTGAESMQDQKVMVADHFVVTIQKGTAEKDLIALLEKLGGKIRRHLPNSPVYLVETGSPDLAVFDAKRAEFQKAALMRVVEPDYVVSGDLVPNDSSFSSLWGLHNTGQNGGTAGADIDASDAWSIFSGNTSVKVGVIDTGIDYTHPDLAANIWTNPGEIPGNGVDDDGNGYIDDNRGWDFLNNDNNPIDDHYHGTHCAGTLGGVGNNGTGVVGVCWAVTLVPLKFLGPTNGGFTSDAIEAVAYATSIGVHLTSNSWGGGAYSQALKDVIDAADAAGILFVAAAGNNGSNNDQYPTYPASYSSSNVIAVAATTRTDARASFSNYGRTTVDLGAPGVEIYSAKPGGLYQNLNGTSMAAPHVAGSCALLKAFRPSLTHTEIRDAILSSVDSTPAMTGYCVSGGRLNIHKALLALDNLRVSPSAPLIARGPQGGPFAPATQSYTLTNEGSTASLTWKAEAGVPWITASPPGGTLAPGASTTVAVAFNHAAKALAAGTYSGAVVFTNSTSGVPLSRTVNLTIGKTDAFTELFASGNDTDNQSWLFTPDSSDSFYSVQHTMGVTSFPTDPTGGTNLTLSLDSFLQLTPSIPVQLYGTSYPSFYVSSKGYITFGSGDYTWTESLSAHFAKPRIAALFDDLDPGSAGTVSWKELPDRVAVTYHNVPQFYQADSNSFQIEMFFDGRIRVTCLGVGASGGLIGLSRGLGTPQDFVASDFSVYPATPPPPALVVAVPPATTEGAGTLMGQGSVTLPGTAVADVTVTLKSSNTGEITVPAAVTVPAGQSRAVFDLTIVDDTVADGAQTVVITTASAGFASGADIISVQDNDGTGTITLTTPASTTEGAGSLQGTVTISVSSALPLNVSLNSSNAGALQVPGGVVIPAGHTSAGFSIQAVDDNRIDGTQNAVITAHVDGWTDASTTIAVLDNETTELAITVPASMGEGTTGSGTVSISGTLAAPLAVWLNSGTLNRLTVPATVTIAAGATSAVFALAAQENPVTDGNAPVTVGASATGFTAAAGTTTVLDNDLHHYVLSTIGAQVRGIPFSVTITAKDINDVTIANHTAPAALAASGAGGAVTVSPVMTTAFNAGVWTGFVTAKSFSDNVVLTANDGAGHTGASNPFAVATGPLHHFAWSAQGHRPQGAATVATVMAQDAGNNLLTAFAGTANLSGYVNNSGGPGILITEINPNLPNEVEFTNVSAADVGIGGWTISIYDSDNGGANPKTFTVPAGVTCAAGQIFRLQESGAGPGTFPQFFTGSSIGWTANSLCPVGVLVCDAAGNPVDFVCAAGLAVSAVTVPTLIPATHWTGSPAAAPSNSTQGFLRSINCDTNSSSDWTTGVPSPGTANTGLSTPFPASIFPVAITPGTCAFTNGVSTCNLSVLQTASSMRLRADHGAGIAGDSNPFDVTGTATLSLQATAIEGEPAVTATLTLSAAPAAELTATLTSSNSAAATVPTSVKIPTGQTSITFPVTVVDDPVIDGTQTATITAQISNWAAATAPLSVWDNENLVLVLSLPEIVAEGSSATATVSTQGLVPGNLTVALASDVPARLAVPATVTIASGTSAATFTVTAVDNTATDGNASLSVNASATSYTGASAPTTVRDDDVHHFTIAAIDSPQAKFVPFPVTVTAYNVANEVLTSYSGTPGSAAAGTGGSVAISPVLLSGFANGVWTGQVTALQTDTNVVLTVNDGAGHTGASNPFQLVNPSVSPTVVEPVAAVSLSSGTNPKAQLVLGPDGSFYGTTQYGGSSNLGTVFKVTPAGVLTPLVNFYGANGSQPLAGLTLASDGSFYGTTSSGGANNLGTIFRMTPAGALTTLVHLNNSTGTGPQAPLLQADDGNFYGTTWFAGSSNFGTIFRMSTAGVYTVMVNFTGSSGAAPGANSAAGLIQANDGALYGVTSSGGMGGSYGTIFKVTLGGVFTSLRSFTGTTGAVLGSAPKAALVQANDGNLYGTTSTGGNSTNYGTIFKVTTAGAFTNLLSFTSTGTSSFPGSTPQAALVQWTDGNLYGTTSLGGTSLSGTVFRVTTGGVLTILRHLSSSNDGYYPLGALVLGSDSKFYGVANSGGGSANKGTVFSISPSNGTFTKLLSFVNSPAEFKNLLQANDGNFYGSTAFGNSGGSSAFRYNPVTKDLDTLTTFTSGAADAVYLIQANDGKLYGAAPVEGSGQVFALTLAGGKTTLASFTGNNLPILGSVPLGSILQASDGLIYGTTSGGGTGGGHGTVWKITTGGAFTSLASFTNTSGAVPGKNPRTRLVQGADGSFFGTTREGGGGFGTVFKITSSGTFATLVSFTGTSGAYPGSKPDTNLLRSSDGNFYGTTTEGGTANHGTIFRIASDGTFTSLLSFTGNGGTVPGSFPSTSLVEGQDGNLYGTTTSTNIPNIVYRVTPAGEFTALAAPGYRPNATLLQASDGFFYGTTSSGGRYGIGTVFRVHPSGTFQTLYEFGASNEGGSPYASASLANTSFSSDSYRMVEASDGYLYGGNGSGIFRVHQQPAVLSIGMADLNPSSVTLTTTVTPNQDDASAFFEYGFTNSYGTQTPAQALPTGTNAVPVNAALTGLQPGAIYHYRLVTVTAQGTLYSADQTFATPGAPQVITGSFANAALTGFSLDGSVNPLGSATTYCFEYGTTTAYGAQTQTLSAGSGATAVRVTATVNSLQPATTYHVRLVATNAYGTTSGGDQVITTLPLTNDPVQPVSQYLNTGTAPLAGLFKAADGYLYGTTSSGGTSNLGTVFRLAPAGTLTTMASFYGNYNADVQGNSPQASLVQGEDGNFYGTTKMGGAYGYGCVFKMTPGGQIATLASFKDLATPRGQYPTSELALGTDGHFYGVTQAGGSLSNGTIFQVTRSGGIATLVEFTGTTGSAPGSSPSAGLTRGPDGNFYGTTQSGGTGGFGTIFKVSASGVLTTLVQFTGTSGAYLGAAPLGALKLGSDGNFYGTTSLGGANNLGTVFKVTPAATFTSLVSFSGTSGSTLGIGPKGALAQLPDGKFYGTTQTGGLNNYGTVFSVTPSGMLTTMLSFTGNSGATPGSSPQGALVTGPDGALYGITNSGGLNGNGSVFKVTSSGLFTTLVNLAAAPNVGRLAQGPDGRLFGATLGGGGANFYGTLFAAPPGGAPEFLATLPPATSTVGMNAQAGLLLGEDGNFYGTTLYGGLYSYGTIFRLSPSGVYTSIVNFTGFNNPPNPGHNCSAPLIRGADGNYYGTTSNGGSSNAGTVFRLTPAGVQTVLVHFTGVSGANLGNGPQAPLTLGVDGNYYGTTTSGGTSGISGGSGTVFRMTPAGVLTTLADFTGSSGSVLGASPLGVLVQASDGTFYGVTKLGGTNNFGSVFRLSPDGVFTNLASFTGNSGVLPGSYPAGGLFAGPDGCFYGVTAQGGAYGQGTIFRVAPDGTVTTLYAFSGRAEGILPSNGLVLGSDGFFYGGNASAIFRVKLPPLLITDGAALNSASSATLNGRIVGEFHHGTVHFEYGLTTAYGSNTPDIQFDPGLTPNSLFAPVEDLQPFQTYHFRLVATTASGGSVVSLDRTFSTEPAAIFDDPSKAPVTCDGFNATGLPLNINLSFAPEPGTTLVLVNNTSFAPVVGTFIGLPEGAGVSASFGDQNFLFRISYAGGDGNDVTLTLDSQVITFPAIASKQTTDGPFTLAASASSGLSVSYCITSGGASATLAGDTVTLTGVPGMVSITANQAGDGQRFAPASPVTRTFAVRSGPVFTQLSSSKGYEFTLGIRSDGTLWGWGENSFGALGNGSTSNVVYYPTRIGNDADWKMVSAGARHAVAVKEDGTLWTWGNNSYGQLGDGSTTTRLVPVQIGTETNWSAAVAGTQHTLALKTDGTLWSWGYNWYGQLGQATWDNSVHSFPLRVGTYTDWTAIDAGSDHNLAQRSDGTLWAWGYNYYSQIGNGTTSTSVNSPVQLSSVSSWNGFSAGSYSNVATRSDGTLWSWGRNDEGQLGDGTLLQRSRPGQVGTTANWRSAQSGGFHVLAVKTDGSLWSWGRNVCGQLGRGFNELTARGDLPRQVGTESDWQLLTAGNQFSLAGKENGTLWAWGCHATGELGYGSHLLQPVARQLGPIAAVSGGDGHTALIRTDGTLWLCGYNGSGQLGIGSADSAQHPTPVQPLPGAQWRSVACGGFHTAAIRSDGSLWMWGSNSYGQLGDGTAIQSNSPVQIGRDCDWQSVSCGRSFTVGLRSNGTLWAWGYNVDGQMGNGSASSNVQLLPAQIGSAADWAAVACGGYHVLALKQDGTLWAWGLNTDGQAGNGTFTTPCTTPVQVGLADSWNSIAGGMYHSVATRSDGSLWTWGRNFNGQLGDGSTTYRSSPQQVGTATDWQSASAGAYHTYGTRLDHTLWSWGYNWYGQLGDGGTTQRTSPAQVGAAAAWGRAFPSNSHTLVTTSDGSLWSCGLALRGATGHAWRNQLVPQVVLPVLSPGQTVAFPPPGRLPAGQTVTLSAMSSSGLPVSYLVSGPASLNGDRLTVTGPGAITLYAWQAGDSVFQSSDVAVQVFNQLLPTVVSLAPSAVSATAATLNGIVNPNGLTTTVRFQHGAGSAYETDTPVILGLGDGAQAQSVSTTLSGLQPGTTYRYRLAATNAGGDASSNDLMFTTNTLFQDWLQNSGVTGSESGPADDFDDDGIPNLMEYAFGADAAVPSNSRLPAVDSPVDSSDGKHYLTISYRRRLSPGNLTYTLQSSDDLATWAAIPGINLEQIGPPVPTGDGVTEVITFRMLPSIEDNPAAKFVRLEVSGK